MESRVEMEKNQTKRKGAMASCWHRWICIAEKFHRNLETLFFKYGYFIAGNPLAVIAVCIIFTGAFGWGFLWLKIESRTEKLYVPKNSRAKNDLDAADKLFIVQTRIIHVIISRKDAKNMLTREAFEAGLELMQDIVNNTAIESVCIKGNISEQPSLSAATAQCLRTDPFQLFEYSQSEIANASIAGKINDLMRNADYIMKNGRPLSANIHTMLGSMKKSSNGTIISAQALRIDIPSKFPKTDQEYESILDWEGKFLKYIGSVKAKFEKKGFDIYYFTFKSIDDSINESTSGDIVLITITFTIMCSFTCMSLGRFRNRVTGHGLAGMAGLLAVTMGIGSSFGLLIICGVKFLAMVGILPFLILGVAIDDMFIILDELDRTDFNLPTREIIAKVLGRVGGTVTMTTLTDLVAFAVSTTSAFPAIQYFCAFAAVGLTFSYLMIMTFFVAFLVFDIKRIKAGRWDIIPLLRKADFKIDAETGLIVSTKQQFSSLIMNMLGRILTHRVGKILVILGSFGLLAAGIIGALSITETFNLRMLGKDGSQYIQFLDKEKEYFADPIPISIVVPGAFRLDTEENQIEYSKISTLAIESHSTMLQQSIDWLREFRVWSKSHNKSTIGSNFLTSLGEFLLIPRNKQYASDIKFSSDRRQILATRIHVFMKNTDDSSKSKDCMLNLREALDKKTSMKAYAAAVAFLYFEQYVLIVPETTRNVVVCGITVLIMTAPFLLHPGILLLMVVSFTALIFELMGMMALWSVSLNSISMIILTMAIGFCVDYSAHVAHTYVTSDAPDAKIGITGALKTTGASVVMGGFTTFLGMVVTAFASSEIFRIFFKMFLGIVGLGLFHGLVVLPTLIAIFKISRSGEIEAIDGPCQNVTLNRVSSDNGSFKVHVDDKEGSKSTVLANENAT